MEATWSRFPQGKSHRCLTIIICEDDLEESKHEDWKTLFNVFTMRLNKNAANKRKRSKEPSMKLVHIFFLSTVIVSFGMISIQLHVFDNRVAEVSPSSGMASAFFNNQKGRSTPEQRDSRKTRKEGKCDHIDNDKDIDDDLKPILKILCHAGYNTSKNSQNVKRSILPKWSKILEAYGPPKIYGLQSCPVFRAKVKPNKRRIAPAGMFNSGTNLLGMLIERNCDFSGLGTQRMKSQVPWGKHMPVRNRANHTAAGQKNQLYYETLPIVIVRDPYTWMQSMCRQSYAAQWAYSKSSCPNIVPYPSDIEAYPRFRNKKHIPVHVTYDRGMQIKYESIAHLWNEWYAEYVGFKGNANEHKQPRHTSESTMEEQAFPFLLVRMEDLIFHAKTIVPQLCECIGGTLSGDEVSQVAIIANGFNSGIDTSGGLMTGLVRSIVNYGNITKRRDGYPKFQLEAAMDTLDSNLMNLLGYRYEIP